MDSNPDKSLDVTNIKRLIEDGRVQELVKAVDVSKKLLADIQDVLKTLGKSSRVIKLLNSIRDLEEKTAPRGPVIGVVGSTGAGKSSIINAILDEENLLPTSGCRACTAVITELSWNDSGDIDKRYRAEIEFITLEEWEAELRIVFQDMKAEEGEEAHISIDPEIAVAIAKIKTVYPKLNKTAFSQGLGIVDDLLSVSEVREVLGATKELYAETAQAFHNQLRKYVDSRTNNWNNSHCPKGKGKETATDYQDEELGAMAVWPLVKIVRIYAKAEALHNGLILVDLPGVQDANAARSAVADKYLERCSGLWIIAPITRAVDDKFAHELLTKTFKLQLQLDGNFSAITMICSKSDDLLVTEASKDLNRAAMSNFWTVDARLMEARKLVKAKKAELRNLQVSRKITDSDLKQQQARKRILKEALKNTERVTQLVSVPPSGEKRKRQELESDDEFSLSEDSESEDVAPKVETPRSQVEREYDHLEASTQLLEGERRSKHKEAKALQKEINGLKSTEQDLEFERRRICIQFRNEFARETVKGHFVKLVRDMDGDDSDDDDDDDDEGATQRRDYDELRRNLGIFCVSARAYMKLKGRLAEDGTPPGFMHENDTEVPMVRRHAMDLADSFRASVCRGYLNELVLFLCSLAHQLTLDESPLDLGEERKHKELNHLCNSIADIEHEFTVDERLYQQHFEDQLARLFRYMARGAKKAKVATAETMDTWFKKSKDGGIAYNTFKAVCIRHGAFVSSTAGEIDLNEKLVEPLKQDISRHWEALFTKVFPSMVDRHGDIAASALRKFRQDLGSRENLKLSPASLNTMLVLIQEYEKQLRTTTSSNEFIAEYQKSASRRITGFTREKMSPAYTDCLMTEKGPKRYKRMQAAIRNHLPGETDLFEQAVSHVEEVLKKECNNLFKSIHEKETSVLGDIKVKVQDMIKGTRMFAAEKPSLEKLRFLLHHADSRFVIWPTDDTKTEVDTRCGPDVAMADVKEEEENDSAFPERFKRVKLSDAPKAMSSTT